MVSIKHPMRLQTMSQSQRLDHLLTFVLVFAFISLERFCFLILRNLLVSHPHDLNALPVSDSYSYYSTIATGLKLATWLVVASKNCFSNSGYACFNFNPCLSKVGFSRQTYRTTGIAWSILEGVSMFYETFMRSLVCLSRLVRYWVG